MNIFHFAIRILLSLFTAMNALAFLHMGGYGTAAGFSFLLSIGYGWPLVWVVAKHMRIRMAAPAFSADNRETNIQTIRRGMGLTFLIIGMVQFSEKKTGGGMIAAFLTITMMMPFNRLFFAPSPRWVIVMRNLGIQLPQPPKVQISFGELLRQNAGTRNAAKPPARSQAQVVTNTSLQLDDPRYFEIIDYIIRLGRDFENYPELNENFNEERYRNYFLPFLNSVSPGYSAKGEVFHRKGKTDILVWDSNGATLFVAECKIWRGEAYLLEGVTQLLTRYVNWRDEKTALIVPFAANLAGRERTFPGLTNSTILLTKRASSVWS